MKQNFVICINNQGYEASLERWKVYRSMQDRQAVALDHIRVIDESGDDYLYPSDFFMAIDLPKPLAEAMTAAR